MAPLHASSARSAPTDADLEAPHEGCHDRQVFLILRRHARGGDHGTVATTACSCPNISRSADCPHCWHFSRRRMSSSGTSQPYRPASFFLSSGTLRSHVWQNALRVNARWSARVRRTGSVDGSPQVLVPTLNCDEELVQMPGVSPWLVERPGYGESVIQNGRWS